MGHASISMKAGTALRLVRREIRRGLFKWQDRCLRDVGRMISEIRDAEVRLETVRQLQKVTGRRRQCYQNVEEILTQKLENFVPAFAEWQSQDFSLPRACGEMVGQPGIHLK